MPVPAWTAMPAVTAAAASGDVALVLHLGRKATGLTLEDAAPLIGCSVSSLSRAESGRRKNLSVRELHRFAEVYGIPLGLLGLAASASPGVPATATVTSGRSDNGGDQMRRRNLLAGTIGIAAGAALPSAAYADPAAATLEDVVFGGYQAQAIPGSQLAAQLGAAKADFASARWAQLARRLPLLLAQASAGVDAAGIHDGSLAHARLATAYTIATHLLLKLYDDELAAATAVQAVQAARRSADPLRMADADRVAAIVLRRADRHDAAQRRVLSAAAQLKADTGLGEARYSAMYGQLLAGAAYTAAMRDDADDAWTLLGEAEDAARAAGASDRFNMLEVAVYRISVARTLGDFGTASRYAHLVDPARITSPERRARYWEDAALAYAGRGRAGDAYEALLKAEVDAPQEVRYRPWAQQLTLELLDSPRASSLSGLRDFAKRIGLPA